MRFLSYNIHDGGTSRLDELSAVIERANPDVVGLVEADDADLVAALARRLQMDFAHAEGKTHASALLTRWTIAESVNHAVLDEAISRSFLEGVVVTPTGTAVPVGVLHLHAWAFEAEEQVREREVAAVLRILAGHRGRGTPHFLCGDFNANAPTQQIDLDRAKPKTRVAWEANGGRIPRRAIRQLLDAGYVDTLRAAKGGAADVTATFTTDRPGQRIDYVFAWGVRAGTIRDAWVDQGDLTVKASDHYPVGAEVQVG